MRRLLLVLLVAAAANRPVAAQVDEALELVPRDALGFIMVNDLTQLSQRVESMAKKLKAPSHTSVLDMIKRGMGIREGLNEKGSALFLFLKPDKISELRFVFAIPVTDAKKVMARFGVNQQDGIHEGKASFNMGVLAGVGTDPKDDQEPESFLAVSVARKGNFVLLGLQKDTESLQQVLDVKESMASTIKPAREWLAKQEICGIANDTGVKTGLTLFLSSPAASAESSNEGQAAQMKAFIADLEKNVRFVGIGAGFGDDGNARLATRVYFDPKGSYSKWIAMAPSVSDDLMARFPDSTSFLTAFARFSPQTTFDWFEPMLAKELPAAKAKALSQAARKVLSRVQEVGVSAKFKGKEGTNLTGIVIATVDDADAFLADATDLATHLEKSTDVKTGNSLKAKAAQVGDRKAVLFEASWKGDENRIKDVQEKSNSGAALAVAVDRTTIVFAPADDAKNAEIAAKAFLEKPAKTLAQEPMFATTSKLLPQSPQLAAFINLSGMGRFEGMRAGNLKASPPVGFAIKTFEPGVEAQFVIPFETIRAAFQSAMESMEKR